MKQKIIASTIFVGLFSVFVQKKRLEVFKLKQEIERLKNLQFEN